MSDSRPGGVRRPPRAASSLLLLLVLLAVAATASVQAFLLSNPAAAARKGPVGAAAAQHRHRPLSLLQHTVHHGWRQSLVPSTALRAATAPGDVDAKAVEAWAAQWKADNTKVRPSRIVWGSVNAFVGT